MIEETNIDPKVEDCNVGTIALLVTIDRRHPKVVDALPGIDRQDFALSSDTAQKGEIIEAIAE